ncbi:MAG: signal peptidase I [Peptostreptococcaceae bacterium]
MSDKLKKEIIDWIKTIAISLVLAFLIVQVIKPTIVSGESMYPTLNDKDYLILNRMSYKFGEVKRGDIIVFKTHLKQDNGKEKDLIKRVIAVEGDSLLIKDSQVYVNNELVEEPYIDNAYTAGEIDVVVPEGKIFAMGDNRENSKDSRSEDVGFIDEKDILGEVMIRLLPLNSIGTVK